MANYICNDEKPDYSKPFSRWNAAYWAMMYGIAEALGPTDWALLTAIYAHLPDVYPGKARLGALAGISESAVDRGRKRLKEAGLINYADDLKGGAKGETTEYIVTDIRVIKIAEEIVGKLEAMNAATRKPRKRAKGAGTLAPARIDASTTANVEKPVPATIPEVVPQPTPPPAAKPPAASAPILNDAPWPGPRCPSPQTNQLNSVVNQSHPLSWRPPVPDQQGLIEAARKAGLIDPPPRHRYD